ncbi:MAG TPA: hypothetical protein VGI99_08330 [Gemmataceae bacterium]
MARSVALLVMVLFAGAVAGQDKPADIVKKAIAAHGGEAVLKRFPAATSKIAGEIMTEPKIPFTGTTAYSMPGKVRVEMQFTVDTRKATTTQVINGDKVSQTENGKPSKLTPAMIEELRESAFIQEMSLLYPLIEGKKYELEAGTDATFDGKECSTVVAKAKGLKPTTLAFDKKTGLLTAMKRKGLAPGDNGLEKPRTVDEVTTFSDYEKISGIMVPMQSKVTHDGKDFLNLKVLEYKPLTKLDDDFMVD